MSTKNDKFTLNDKCYMQLAIKIANDRVGLTGTNPSVGCVIAKNNKIISVGQTDINGINHAEYNAIKNAKESLYGSTMYVTLEPCNHYGKTPPCTNLIIKNKIKNVIYSIEDIDPRTKGKTNKILSSIKINVKKKLFANQVGEIYKSYIFNQKKKLPYITGKLAISQNDIFFSKKQKYITNNYSKKVSHFLRYKNDSILISYKTLNIDNPKLTCRINGLESFSPRKIILDKNLKSNINRFIFNCKSKKNSIIFYNSASRKKISLFKKKGIKLIKINLDIKKKININILLKKLYSIGCRNLLVEGGKNLTKSFLTKGLFNQFYLFRAIKNVKKNGYYLKFNPIKFLSKNFRYKSKINSFLDEDVVYIYKK